MHSTPTSTPPVGTLPKVSPPGSPKRLHTLPKRLKCADFGVDGEDEADRQLLVEFDVVISEFAKIDQKYRQVIIDITKRMGNGMADYANNAAHNLVGVDTLEDFDMYCYYVAGLVGEGLTRLFISSGKENPKLSQVHDLYSATFPLLFNVFAFLMGTVADGSAYSMGLFLQKTNIIRDYREDLDDKRKFWPRQVWSKYADDLGDFADPRNIDAVPPPFRYVW